MLALEPLSRSLLGWFAETTLVASALALVAHVVGRLGGPGPAVRHLLWLAVLIKLMTPPLVHWPWSRPLGPIAWPPRVASPSTQVASPSRTTPTIPATPRPGGDRGLDADHPIASVAAHHEVEPGPGTNWPAPVVWIFAAWLVGSVVVGSDQVGRIVRFRRSLRRATRAPDWLIAEAEGIGRQLSVGVPTIRVVDRLATPLLWCLGRPLLLLPSGLLESLEADRWRGVLAHELAHLRRGDPWVGRLELVAMIAWWWNPLFWLARRRVDFEAELACDAWVLWALPDDRIEYAESLVRIAAPTCPARPTAPSLGVAGAGRIFERRLIMILSERVPHSAPLPGLLAATLLAAISVPSWTLGAASPAPAAPVIQAPDRPSPTGDDDRVVDDDDEDSQDSPKQKAKEKAKQAREKAEARAKAREDAKADKKATRPDQGPSPDFEKAMEALGQKLGKEMEEKLGPGSEFQKAMEAIGKDIEAKFGPDFQKKMEAMGKEIEAKFGPDSAFAREMKTLGDQMAKEFGPGSDFEKKMKDMKDMKDVAKAKGEADDAKGKSEAARAKADAAKGKADAARAKVDPTSPSKVEKDKAKRARRIEVLESRIDQLMKELKQLKDEEGRDEDEDA
jgi:beta-lactamase regulating signal transducer with metallopeptidase domain